MFDFIDFILRYKKSRDCRHPNALLNSNEGYCPDCGAYLKKFFYIVRCKHCDIKRESNYDGTSIYPSTRFCPNCGGEEFYVEKLEKISIVDIRYAVHIKEVIENDIAKSTTQIWIEHAPKLIPIEAKG